MPSILDIPHFRLEFLNPELDTNEKYFYTLNPQVKNHKNYAILGPQSAISCSSGSEGRLIVRFELINN